MQRLSPLSPRSNTCVHRDCVITTGLEAGTRLEASLAVPRGAARRSRVAVLSRDYTGVDTGGRQLKLYIINDSGKYGFVTRTALSRLAGHRPPRVLGRTSGDRQEVASGYD